MGYTELSEVYQELRALPGEGESILEHVAIRGTGHEHNGARKFPLLPGGTAIIEAVAEVLLQASHCPFCFNALKRFVASL